MRAAASTSRRSRFRRSSLAASSAARVRVAGGEEFDHLGGNVHAAGGVDARRQAKGNVEAGELPGGGIEGGGSEEGAQSGADRAAQFAQAERGDGAVFAVQGDRIGNGGDGSHLEKAGQSFFAGAGLIAAFKNSLGELERNCRAAEKFLRIWAAGLVGVQDCQRDGNGVPASRRWWSVMMRSRPSLRAVSASAKARMPVSTVMTRRTPSA